jgi:DNA-binding transcriptional ArsR family regulator
MNALAALGEPTRRRIVEILAAGSLASGEIAERFEISAPAVSQHLKVLRQARLVRVRFAAQRRIYELNRAGIDEIAAWIGDLRRLLGEQPPNLEPFPDD